MSFPTQTALALLSSMVSSYPPLQNLQKSMPSGASVVPVNASTAPNPIPPPNSQPQPSSQPQPQPPPQSQSQPQPQPVTQTSQIASIPSAPNGAAGTSPPATLYSNLCDECHLRPKYADGHKTHAFCSRTCAAKFKGPSAPVGHANNSNSGNCVQCHQRPRYVDGTKTHLYCSRTCANNAKAKPQHQRQQSHPHAAPANNQHCKIPGCFKPVHRDNSGKPGDYCSMAHKNLAETSCLMCLKVPKQGGPFCSKQCEDDVNSKGPMVLEIPAGHAIFKSVADQFKTSWRHTGTTCPAVKKVYKIVSDPANFTKYTTYRDAVEARGQFVASGRSAGNENRRWHGTTRECNFGDEGQTQFCGGKCPLCSIVRTSYDLGLFGKKTGWGRFGAGIYTSSTSSKSNDYSNNVTKSPWKAMLLNKVVVGRGYKMTHDNTSLTSPPAGYDSVLAEKGGSLNYDELVVYTNDAIRPSYLVMYEA
ncbi:hypothetical protein JAAARDRAFT_40054 [Jaapia argillacea MUCL 33604]|uniref:PARP catalytic domain-containing protein n=1 Tax=Jaapia argillacea MUCL 33604 TaxID=933084 RepID=A0A067PDA8_9AGAM|nr:hypothetical protein JAAARDRAFT_40054 [Jaapia argillacea MUCL 33604]